jgi:hypothetical protein
MPTHREQKILCIAVFNLNAKVMFFLDKQKAPRRLPLPKREYFCQNGEFGRKYNLICELIIIIFIILWR